MAGRIREQEHTHRARLDQIEQLQTQNAMLQIVAKSVDVPLAFQALAARIARLVPCDRVGLALLNEAGDEFQTYTARVQEEERRARPRPDVMFRVERTVLGSVVRSQEPMIVPDISESAGDFLDANVLHTSGFGSILIVPLISKGRIGRHAEPRGAREERVRRERRGDDSADCGNLCGGRRRAAAADDARRYQTMEAMSELTLSVGVGDQRRAADDHRPLRPARARISGSNLQRDLATIVRQAQRIAGLLEQMRKQPASASARRKLRSPKRAFPRARKRSGTRLFRMAADG